MSDTHIDPTSEQFGVFKSLPRDTPIQMLNLVRFKDKATYPADHPLAKSKLTGAEAYQTYGNETGPILKSVGGTIVWRGAYETVLIGPSDEAWDAMFIVQYPNSGAFLAMVTNPEYQKAVVHRQSAVLTSRLIRCGASSEGTTFG